jgi:hypothetical protein
MSCGKNALHNLCTQASIKKDHLRHAALYDSRDKNIIKMRARRILSGKQLAGRVTSPRTETERYGIGAFNQNMPSQNKTQ